MFICVHAVLKLEISQNKIESSLFCIEIEAYPCKKDKEIER